MAPTDDRDLEVASALGNISARLDAMDKRLDAQYKEYEDHRTRTEVYMRDGCKLAQDNKSNFDDMKAKLWKVAGGIGIALLGANQGIDWLRDLLLK